MANRKSHRTTDRPSPERVAGPPRRLPDMTADPEGRKHGLPARARATAAVLVTVLLANCVGADIEQIRRTRIEGSPFTRALTEEYREIALFEADEMYDWLAAGYFARKGLRAAGGEEVGAEPIGSWALPPEKVAEMSAARQRLLAALRAGARAKLPELAAHAQGRFDCWVEQQTENRQPAHIGACRDKFYDALTRLEAAAVLGLSYVAAPHIAARPEGAGHPDFLAVLFFRSSSSAIGPEGRRVVRHALQEAGDLKGLDLAVVGHADSVGDALYNQRLSLRRAAAVGDLLVELGIPVERIIVRGRGDRDPAVPTQYGRANRRVEIMPVPTSLGLMGWGELGPPTLS